MCVKIWIVTGQISLTLGLRWISYWAGAWYCLSERVCNFVVGSLLIGILDGSTSSPHTALITHDGLLGLRAQWANSHFGDVRRIFFRCRLPDPLLGFGNRRGAGKGRLSRLCLAEGSLVWRKSDCFLVFRHHLIHFLWIWSLLSQCKSILVLQSSWCRLNLCRTLWVPSRLAWISILPTEGNQPRQVE